MYVGKMDDDGLIIPIGLSYLVVSLLLHIMFFTTIFVNSKRNLLTRWFKQTDAKPVTLDETHSSCSSLTSEDSLETKLTLDHTVRSISVILCTCSFLTNWLCLVLIYFLPKFYPSASAKYCTIQSFFLHVFTLFHLHLTIGLRLFWHFCFTFEKSWQTLTYRRISYLLMFVFICLCLFTLPSMSNEWASVVFDKVLQICLVNYAFNYSYTFFVVTLTCLIPFILLLISHRRHMKEIHCRLAKTLSIIDDPDLTREKIRFQCTSYVLLLWSFFLIVLIICFHIPITQIPIRTTVLYTQLITFLIDPIIYIFIFRSLSIITLLRPNSGAYFV
ncbi:unnamed protein product [Adineta ricciae]|uniref:G-protein coupled receptors family 1 profile domain-containing protein n=1 Tax=Adineta ricciae TaxID=249248 RepID=A0A814M334_ADIRI|nr:unnamed protein product [Adineta ricciae]